MDIKEMLDNAAAETGWNEQSQIILLCSFLDQYPEIHDQFAAFLNDNGKAIGPYQTH